METAIRHTHLLSVILFLLIYLVKTALLLANKEDGLAKFTKAVKIPEMIISTLFLVTGVYMLTQIPEIKSLMIIKIIVVLASIPLAVIGFKKKNKALASISLLMIVAAYGLAEMSKKPSSVKATVGAEIYSVSCARCHGDDGKLGLLGAPDLSASAMDLATRIEIIKNGKGAMTPFAGVLTEEQIKAVAEYSEGLKK
ncbi:MAG: SirB2 family protein [Bacteroidia bacterium]|jgi:cytochrome c553